MKPNHDRTAQNTWKPEHDLTNSFEKLWHTLDERERREASKVRLVCNGELVGIGSVGLVGLLESAQRRADRVRLSALRTTSRVASVSLGL